jgi:hypothetical protein
MSHRLEIMGRESQLPAASSIAIIMLGVPIDELVRRTIDGVDHMLEHELYTRNFDAYPNVGSAERRRLGF